MPQIGPMEIMVIFVVALLVLGPSKLPEAGRQVGRAMTEFRRWSTGVQTELREALEIDDIEPDYGANLPPAAIEEPGEPQEAEEHPKLRSPSQFPDGQSFS